MCVHVRAHERAQCIGEMGWRHVYLCTLDRSVLIYEQSGAPVVAVAVAVVEDSHSLLLHLFQTYTFLGSRVYLPN